MPARTLRALRPLQVRLGHTLSTDVEKHVVERLDALHEQVEHRGQNLRAVRLRAGQADMTADWVQPTPRRERYVVRQDGRALPMRVDAHLIVAPAGQVGSLDCPRVVPFLPKDASHDCAHVLVEHESHAEASARAFSTSAASRTG